MASLLTPPGMVDLQASEHTIPDGYLCFRCLEDHGFWAEPELCGTEDSLKRYVSIVCKGCRQRQIIRVREA